MTRAAPAPSSSRSTTSFANDPNSAPSPIQGQALRQALDRLTREGTVTVRSQGFGPSSLTTAELRVLQLLPTHLSIGEIADRLYVSRNTVKSQTIAIYRKLGTSSRSGAVEIAVAAGLVEATGVMIHRAG